MNSIGIFLSAARRLMLLIVLSALLTGCDRAEFPKLRVGTHPGYPPFTFWDNGKICGLEPLIVREIAAVSGRHPEWKECSFDYLLTALETGQIDLAAAAIAVTEEHRKKADFSEPYAESELVMMVPAGSPIRSVRDLAGKLIGVHRGTAGDDYVTRNIRVPIRFASLDDAIKDLQSGQVDALVLLRAPLPILLRAQKKLKILEPALERRPLAIAVRKGNAPLLKTVNQVLRKLKQSGRLQKIRQQEILHALRLAEQQRPRKNELHAAVFANVPPYSFLRNGKPDGIEPAILKRIADELNLNLVMEPVGFDVMFEMIAEKNNINIGAGLVSYSPHQEKDIDFSIPYRASHLALYLPQDSAISCPEQARGKRIGVVYGTSSERYVRRHIGVPECYTGQVLMFRALCAGDLDGVVTEQYAGDFFSRKYPNIRRLAAPLQEEKYVFVIRRENAELQNGINRILQRLLDDGTIRQLVEQYYREYQP